ncbi:MAG: dienelactone hydrolase [Candidatus Riflebacteria bacterium]|nr:dienelactone hydrolase [Candidatus Riflebacteria bacterium]
MAGPTVAAGTAYDPLTVPAGSQPQTVDLTVHDPQRHREIPTLIYLPQQRAPVPVVLFSHGLGGSRHGCAYLGRHWAGRGYVAVFIQHPGSDTSVWRDQPLGQRMAAMRQAAGLQNFLLRVEDVPTVLDRLERLGRERGSALAGRIDPTRVGMSGHSFGAVTAQAVSGQSLPLGRQAFTDRRVRAALAFSPSAPRAGFGATRAFDGVRIPWMLMTGTKDVASIGGATVESRLSIFPALPPGGKYELVLFEAQHSAFADRGLPGDALQRNPNHHRAILALSTAFWDAWLADDPAARRWLDGDGPASVLEKRDRWQRK